MVRVMSYSRETKLCSRSLVLNVSNVLLPYFFSHFSSVVVKFDIINLHLIPYESGENW
jgi:hypothetical protein